MTMSRIDWLPQPGHILLVDLEAVRGTEQDGARPALVFSHPDMNILTRRVIVCPIYAQSLSLADEGLPR